MSSEQRAVSSCGDMEPSASPQMLRGGRVRFAEGMAPRITRIYTYEICGGLRDLRAIWVEVGHWWGLRGNKQY